MISLASNENPMGMPAAARQAAADALAQGGNYPDPNGTQLKQALSVRLDVPADWLVLGSGSCEILTLAAQACAGEGDEIIFAQYGFVVYAQAAALVHARAVVVPARDFGHDLDAMAAAITPRTRLVFIANPNNPTGTFLSGEQLLAFLQQVPAAVTVLLDEAYTEYLAPTQRYNSVGWLRRFPNLLVARTFSKAYGLAGLRVGFGMAQPALAGRLNALRPRFNVTSPALAAAVAALDDTGFLRRSYEINTAGREQLASGLAALGLPCLPSAGNFLMVRPHDAVAAHAKLLDNGIAVSLLDMYGLGEWLRITIGLPEQNSAVLAVLAG